MSCTLPWSGFGARGFTGVRRDLAGGFPWELTVTVPDSDRFQYFFFPLACEGGLCNGQRERGDRTLLLGFGFSLCPVLGELW